MIKSSQGDKGSFVSATEFEVEQGLIDFKNDFNRQLFWNGDGTLATVSANVVASTTMTVTGRESTEDGNKFLDVGLVFDVYRGAVLIEAAVEITAISGTTTATLTLSRAVSCLASDVLVRSGAYNLEVQGVLTSQDGGTGTIFNIDRSLYPVFQGNVTNASAGQMTLNLLKQVHNNVRRRGGNGVDFVCSDYDSERFYEKLLIVDKRYIGKVKGDGTFSSKDENYLEYGGVPWVVDKDTPQRVWMLSSKTWKKYVLCELEWQDESGAMLIAQTSADSYEARLRHFANLFCEKPASNGVLRNYVSP